MRKIQLKTKQKILSYLLLAGIIVFLILRFIFLGLNNRLKQLNQQIKLTEGKLKRVLEIQRMKDVVTADYKEYQPYLKLEQLSERDTVEELLKEVESIAKDSGVSVINLSPQEGPEQTKEYKKYKADIRLEASFEQILNFLNKIQEDKLLIKLDRISLVPKDEEAQILRVEGTISIAIP
jgi:Tfp pilus assembly protein PilO